MKILSILHRWSGGLIGLLLVVLGLSGTILLWEGSWIGVPGARDPAVENIAQMTAIADKAFSAGATRVTFAGEELGLHAIGMKGGAGAYVNQAGETAASWSSQWERPELWIFDLHHHLFAGENGEMAAGIAGLFGLAFVVTGSILWWRSRRTFKLRIWPKPFQPGPIVKTHRDLGIVVAPLLLLTFLTGSGIVFSRSITPVVLSPFGKMEGRVPPPKVEGDAPAKVAVGPMLAQAKARFPNAEIRRMMAPMKPGGPWSVRLRQPSEWAAGGRTAVWFDGSGKLLRVDDPAAASRATAIFGTFLPLHSGKLGLVHKLLMTVSGVALVLLGGLAMWSFWWRRWIHRQSARGRKYPAAMAASDRSSEAAT